jgi:SAM-dependent methyltransferase
VTDPQLPLTASTADLYRDRPLAAEYPRLGELSAAYFIPSMTGADDDRPRFERVLLYLQRLIGTLENPTACVLGCGPVPQPLRILKEQGWRVSGVEPVEAFVRNANEFLGGGDAVVVGSAESMPLETGSQDVVFFENVLEHVDSPSQSLREIFRVLKPGGVAYVTTTNRLRFDWRGRNGEYRVPFYNWLPKAVKEGYIFQHLHYHPALANFTERPAVHWFTYADLCRLGREVGFSSFYSPLDLRRAEDSKLSGSGLRRAIQGSPALLRLLQRSAWLRTLVLTQVGSDIFMKRRGE